MIHIDNIEVMNFKGAFRGMRNPLESWRQNDSKFVICDYNMLEDYVSDFLNETYEEFNSFEEDKQDQMFDELFDNSIIGTDDMFVNAVLLGNKDLSLAQKLILGGTDHSKFMRQIFVSMDINAPLYWWKELDQYRIGCTTNSESTMHKLATTPIRRCCFSFQEHLSEDASIIANLEFLRLKYLETNNKMYWQALVERLPSSWNQMRTWTANYQVLRNIYFSRKNHKLSEWITFTKMIEALPYGKELITITKEK